ncbi:hypothetical protein FB45DRAFT_944427 [Roridomyces roridus]|uniref:Uncharacterized protein n=1 Tax=Roridomyces roridus TaxID=1738132 RepID=A0AAD7B410_9AGAR|nr:hypothetical protein FB45DRAFT_944427 [Roridomyces roridus]
MTNSESDRRRVLYIYLYLSLPLVFGIAGEISSGIPATRSLGPVLLWVADQPYTGVASASLLMFVFTCIYVGVCGVSGIGVAGHGEATSAASPTPDSSEASPL